MLTLTQIMTPLRKILSNFFGEETKQALPDCTHSGNPTKNTPTKLIWDGMIEANQLATDCIKSLKDANWAENSQMSEDNLKKFLEFLFYQFHIPEKARRSSLTLNFKQGSKVVNFVSELEAKM